jgi:hypothetical protein
MRAWPDVHDASRVIDSSHEQQSGPDRDSLLRIEVFGPAERIGATQPRGEAPSEPASEPGQAPPQLDSGSPPVQPAEPHHEESLTALETEMIRREADVMRRERALSGAEGLVEAGTADVERRERKLMQMESTIQERMRELDEREERVERREIELEGAFSLREDRIEARESELAELDDRLRRKEEDLARYVGQLQAQLTQRS